MLEWFLILFLGAEGELLFSYFNYVIGTIPNFITFQMSKNATFGKKKYSVPSILVATGATKNPDKIINFILLEIYFSIVILFSCFKYSMICIIA